MVRTPVVPTSPSESPSSPASDPGGLNFSDTVQMVKYYARQETLGPLKGWLRYVSFGLAGSLVLGLGLVVGSVGVLRLLQTETGAFSGPNTSILAYVITMAVCLAVIALAGWQIKRRSSLQRKETS
jgi:hypothetical protein